MTTPYPPYITWPVLIFGALVTIGRYVFFSHTRSDVALSNVLAIYVASNLLRERPIQDWLADHGVLSVTASQQLSLAITTFAAAEFLIFISTWAGLRGHAQPLRRPPLHALAAMVAAGFLLAATPARNAGKTMEEFGGWWSLVAWIILAPIIVVAGIPVVRSLVHEFRRPGAPRSEKLAAAGGICIAVAAYFTTLEVIVLTLVKQLGWADTTEFMTWANSRGMFTQLALFSLLVTVPFVRKLRAWAGMDNTSRSWRSLQPLLSDMLAGAPEISFYAESHSCTGRKRTVLDIHQAIVQIRDAALHLRTWACTPDSALVREQFDLEEVEQQQQHEAATAALRLACALRNKKDDLRMCAGTRVEILRSRSADLHGEIAEMLLLAHYWPRAKYIAAGSTRCCQLLEREEI